MSSDDHIFISVGDIAHNMTQIIGVFTDYDHALARCEDRVFADEEQQLRYDRYFIEEMGRRLRDAPSVSWSPEKPGLVLPGDQGRHSWPVGTSANAAAPTIRLVISCGAPRQPSLIARSIAHRKSDAFTALSLV